LAQLQETSELLGQGLGKKLAGSNSKRPRNQLDNAPDNLPDNAMAPPPKAKRQRVNKVLFFEIDIIPMPSGDWSLSRLPVQS
jgi:hypothetical protein